MSDPKERIGATCCRKLFLQKLRFPLPRHINMGMTDNERNHTREIANWLASRFVGMNSASVRMTLVNGKTVDGIYQPLTDETISKLARRFQGELNSLCFGNAARRYGKELPLTAALHSSPHIHLHIQVGLSERISLLRFESFTETFCLKNSWVSPCCYTAQTHSDIASQIYNSRFGSDTVILF